MPEHSPDPAGEDELIHELVLALPISPTGYELSAGHIARHYLLPVVRKAQRQARAQALLDAANDPEMPMDYTRGWLRERAATHTTTT